MSNIFIGLKNTCLGVLDREKRDKDNETSLKEGGVTEMSTTVLHSRADPSLEYLLVDDVKIDNILQHLYHAMLRNDLWD